MILHHEIGNVVYSYQFGLTGYSKEKDEAFARNYARKYSDPKELLIAYNYQKRYF